MKRTLCLGQHMRADPAKGEDWQIVAGRCSVTGRIYAVSARESDLNSWLGGELIQLAIPYLSGEDREFLISGTSPEGWNQLFGQRGLR